MPGTVDRVKSGVARLRRRPTVDHVLLMQAQYGKVNASQQAGAVTYFGFLSVFPVLALAFFVVGYVAKVYPDAQDTLVSAIKSLFPGLIGTGTGKLNLDDITANANTAGIVGLLGVLYSGLGWLSALRSALIVVFELPDKEQPNFIIGKARDLATLAIIGFVLLFAVAFTGFVSGFSKNLLGYVGLSSSLGWLVQILVVVLGLLANAVLFFAMFWLLANPDDVPNRSLWSGALLGAIGFEILKQLSTLLIKSTQGQPAFQVFGLALILVVWINYFSRVVLYAAAWAYTSPAARAARVANPAAPVQGPQVPALSDLAAVHDPDPRSRAKPFLVGAFLGVVAAVAAVGGRSD